MASFQRIVIIGATSTGKTTLARTLARRLNIPAIDLDELYWGPNWTETPIEQFRLRVAEALSGDTWIMAGNYSGVREMIWIRAQLIVWLDYPLPVVMWRLMRRTVRRIVSQEVLFSGNRETWRTQFFSRDSLILWALKTHAARRRSYAALLASELYTHLQVVHLRSPRATEKWLHSFQAVAS